MSSGSTLTLGTGTATNFPSFSAIHVSLTAGSTVIYASTASQVITRCAFAYTTNLPTFTGASIKLVNNAITVDGNLSVNTSGETLQDGGFQITKVIQRCTLTVVAGATLQIGSGSATITTFPTLFTNANISLAPTSTVIYNTITNPQTIAASIGSVGPATYGNLTLTSSTGNTKTAAGAFTIAGNLTLSSSSVTFADGGDTITVNGNISNSGTHTSTGAGEILLSGGSASHTLTGTPAIYGNIELNDANGANLSSTGTTTISGNLKVTNGTLTLAAFTTSLSVTGSTTIASPATLTLSSATGARTFTGDVTVNGTWNNSGNATATLNGNLTDNGTFTSGTAAYILAGTSKTISGSSSLSFAALAVTGSYGDSISSLTVTTAFSGATGTLTMGANTILLVGGTLTVATLNCITNLTNTVNYNGAGAQTIKSTNYNNLILSNAGAKTAGGSIVASGDFTISGSATFDGGTSRSHTFDGNWIVNTSAATPFTYTTANTIAFTNPPIVAAANTLSGTSSATLAFYNLFIFNDSSGINANLNFSVTYTMSVTGHAFFTPAANVVVSGSGTLAGSGRIPSYRTAFYRRFQQSVFLS